MSKNWCFWTVVLEKTHESPLDSKKIKPVNLKGDQPYIFTGRTDAEAPVFWSSDVHRRLIDAGKDWGQKEKRASEDETAGQHHWCNEHELGQILWDGEGQGGLVCCSPWGHKELDMNGWLNNNNNKDNYKGAQGQGCASREITPPWNVPSVRALPAFILHTWCLARALGWSRSFKLFIEQVAVMIQNWRCCVVLTVSHNAIHYPKYLSTSPTSFPTCILLAHPAPATLTFFPFLTAKHLLILGLLYLFFLLSVMIFLQISARLVSSFHFNFAQKVLSVLLFN